MEQVSISTPENIDLEYDLAGLGSRFIACLIDYVIQIGAIAFLTMILMMSIPDLSARNFYMVFKSTFAAGICILIFLITFGYFIFFETIWTGETPGKKTAGIKVIKDSGEPINFYDSLIRNLFRIVDFLPFYYFTGIAFVLFHTKKKRIGDIVANTMVITTKSNLAPAALPDLPVFKDFSIDISMVKEEDYAVIRSYILRRNDLDIDARSRIIEKIALPLIKRMNLEINPDYYEEFIEAAAQEYRNHNRLI